MCFSFLLWFFIWHPSRLLIDSRGLLIHGDEHELDVTETFSIQLDRFFVVTINLGLEGLMVFPKPSTEMEVRLVARRVGLI